MTNENDPLVQELRENLKTKDAVIEAKNDLLQIKDEQLTVAKQLAEDKSEQAQQLREKLIHLEMRIKEAGSELETSTDGNATDVNLRAQLDDVKRLRGERNALHAEKATLVKTLDRVRKERNELLEENDSLKKSPTVKLESPRKPSEPLIKTCALFLSKGNQHWTSGVFTVTDSQGVKSIWELMIFETGWMCLYSKNDKIVSAGIKVELLSKTCTVDYGPFEPMQCKSVQMMHFYDFKQQATGSSIKVDIYFSIRDQA